MTGCCHQLMSGTDSMVNKTIVTEVSVRPRGRATRQEGWGLSVSLSFYSKLFYWGLCQGSQKNCLKPLSPSETERLCSRSHFLLTCWESNTQSLWGKLHPNCPNYHLIRTDGRQEKETKAGCDVKKTFAPTGHWSDSECEKKQWFVCRASSPRKVKEGPLAIHEPLARDHASLTRVPASLARVPALVSLGCYNKIPSTGPFQTI